MSKAFSVTPIFGKSKIDYKQDSENYLLLQIEGKVDESSTKRPSLDIALCIDTSPSMGNQNKLPIAKKSAILLIDNLLDKDHLHLITYSNSVTTHMTFVEMTDANKKRAVEVITYLSAGGGGTNISGTLIRAFDAFTTWNKIEDTTESLRRIIFLTDGCPTSGETSLDKLLEMVETIPSNVQLTTMGFGAASDKPGYGMGGELNVAFLQEMADKGKGNYYYMQDADSCRTAFAHELAGLLSCVAQDVKLTIIPNTDRLKLVEVLDNVNNEVDNDDIHILLPDLMAEEKRNILIKCTSKRQDKSWARKGSVADIKVSYKDTEQAKTVSDNYVAKLFFTTSTKADTELNADVKTQIAVMESIKAQKKAFEQASSGDFVGASQTINAATFGFMGIGTPSADHHLDVLKDMTTSYSTSVNFTGAKNRLSANIRSVGSGRSSGGDYDTMFTNHAQKHMKRSFDDSDKTGNVIQPKTTPINSDSIKIDNPVDNSKGKRSTTIERF